MDKQSVLKRAIRRKVFSGSFLLDKNNREYDLDVLLSKKYPTQVVIDEKHKYIRINEKDIEPKTIDNLLSTMLGMFNEVTNSDEFEKELENSVVLNKKLDNLDIDTTQVREIITLNKKVDKPSTKEGDFTEKDTELMEDMSEEVNKDLKEAIRGYGSTVTTDKDSDEDIKIDEEEELEDIEPNLEKIEQKSSSDNFIVEDTSQLLNKIYLNSTEQLKKDLSKMKKLSKTLIKALKGKDGKSMSITPSKKLSMRSLALDRDKVYIRKKSNTGHKIKLNLLIDMSGSMYGEPIRNAMYIIYIFNQLAKQGLVDMHVLYSSSYTREEIKLPVKDEEIISRVYTRGDEGLRKTSESYVNILKNINLICITDGQITDQPISKQFWSKNKIISTGVYVKETKEYTKFSSSLDKWFNHSFVRPSVEELVNTLVRIGLK